MSDQGNHAAYRLSSYDHSRYMRLDRPAVRALNLLPEASDGI